jgi:hypothetical protein
MDTNNNPPSMNQAIFNMGLSTETISVYLLCCGLADEGKAISTKNLDTIWNSTKEALVKSLTDLEKRKILQKVVSDMKDTIVYRLTDIHTWDMKGGY